MIRCLVIWCLALLVVGCGSGAQPLGLQAEESNPLAFLSVSCAVSADGFPPATTGLHLKIKNPSARRLDGVSVTVDDSYTAALQDLRMVLGFWEGSPALGRSSILPGDDLVFVFSHDISNHGIMKNGKGEAMPRTLVPASITIRTDDGSGTWSVK